MKTYIFEKRQLKLKEEDINLQSDSVSNSTNPRKEVSVDPISAKSGSANLATDISKAKSKNPNASTYVFNASSYADKNKSKQPTNINISANSPTDLSNELNKAMTSDPQIAQAVNNGTATVKATLQNESISLTKRELDKILLNL